MKKWMTHLLLGLGLLVITCGMIWQKAIDVIPVFNLENSQKPKSDVESDPTIRSEEKEFIANQHDFYNKTTGWGEIDELHWKEQKSNAEAVIDFLSNSELNAQLQVDFSRIQQLSTFIADGEKDKEAVLYLHRIFHDLDIEVNGYRSKDYFEVTDVGNGEKTEAVMNLIENK